MRQYDIQVIKGSFSETKAPFQGYILEDGSQIGKFSRLKGQAYYDMKVVWYTERGRDRFVAFCDCLTVAETIEALGD